MTPWHHRVNALGRTRTPFLFIIDFEQQQPIILPLSEVDPAELLYDFQGVRNHAGGGEFHRPLHLIRSTLDVATYRRAFAHVMQQLRQGNSFLVNLTFPTEIKVNFSLQELFFRSEARYKLWLRNQLAVFSPESFVRISNGQIRTYPMKGTIDATVPNARQVVLDDPKEKAEHTTIVDLLRNDLSRLATRVCVKRFRYVEEINTARSTLLQVSSEIEGTLPSDYHARLGDLLSSLLPAGSISGAPKPKTLEIIRNAELGPRGYYTGVMGYYDGERLDSGVMIRFIEQHGDQYFYRSGGGITARSVLAAEYQELHDKVYVPIR